MSPDVKMRKCGMYYSGKWARLFTGLVLAIGVCVIGAGAASAAQGKGQDIPIRAARALGRAQDLAAKKKLAEAVKYLLQFRAKGNCAEVKGDGGSYCHYTVDFNLGNFLAMQGKPAEASRYYRWAVEKAPDYAPAWLNLGVSLNEQGRHLEAADAFLRGYEIPEKKEALNLYYAAVCTMLGGKPAAALPLFERLLSAHPDKVTLEWRESLVSLLLDLGKERRALPHLEILAAQSRGDKRIRWQEVLLYQYISLGLKKKALAYVTLLTREHPLEPKWWKGQAHLHLGEQRLSSALVALTVYGGLVPLTESEKKLVADLCFSIGIPVEGIRLYQEVVTEKGVSLKAAERLTMGYQSLHRPEEALAWVDRALALEEGKSLLTTRGHLLYELERYGEAADTFRKVAGLKGKSAGKAWMMVGYSAWREKDLPRARRAFSRAAKYPAQKKRARQILASLKAGGTL